MRAPFVTIEGIDGTGKSTVADFVKQVLEARGYEVFCTKEPGDSNIGQTIRHLLFKEPGSARREDDPTHEPLTGGQVDCLMLACHLGHVEYRIKPALAAGKAVLSDRYYDSQFAYAHGRNHSVPIGIEAFGKEKGPEPDITILLVGDVETCLARAKGRDSDKNALEPDKQKAKQWARVENQQRIQNAYLHQIAPLPRTITVNVKDSSVQQVLDTLAPMLARRIGLFEFQQKKAVLTQPALFNGSDHVLDVARA